MDIAFRRALRADLDTVVDAWVDAFSRDPYLRWIQPDDQHWPAFGREWMGMIAAAAFERGHTFLARHGEAAIAWIPPDLSLLSQDLVAHALGILERYGGPQRAGAAYETIMAARAHDLDEPHWTLQYLGVRAVARGTGLGAAMVAAGLAHVDADERSCGLVSSNPRNVPFYERLGFSVIAEVATPDGAVTLRPMVRRLRA